jgi:hypothetical protein
MVFTSFLFLRLSASPARLKNGAFKFPYPLLLLDSFRPYYPGTPLLLSGNMVQVAFIDP